MNNSPFEDSSQKPNGNMEYTIRFQRIVVVVIILDIVAMVATV